MMRLLAGSGIVLSGMALAANAQVLNGGFENWADCSPDFWATSDVCGVVEPVTKTTDAHSGAFAARGAVVNFFGQNFSATLQSGDDATGIPISQRFATVDGFYKFSPTGGDRFGVNVAFFKGNLENVVAQGAVIFPATQNYTAFSVPMTYQNAETPDGAVIQISIIGPVTGSDYHAGSVFQVDDITFGTGGGGGQRPSLTIALEGADVVVSWPADAEGYKLQTTGLLLPEVWGDVQGLAPTARSYRFTPTTQGYFRLFHP
jgi:hypothetical protein